MRLTVVLSKVHAYLHATIGGKTYDFEDRLQRPTFKTPYGGAPERKVVTRVGKQRRREPTPQEGPVLPHHGYRPPSGGS
jgi:hypothetical protein